MMVGEHPQVRGARDPLDDLVSLGTMTAQCAAFLHAAVAAGLNILVAVGTRAGKPTRR